MALITHDDEYITVKIPLESLADARMMFGIHPFEELTNIIDFELKLYLYTHKEKFKTKSKPKKIDFSEHLKF
jgi:hypothetical protein